MLMCNSLFAWSLPARLPDRCFGASPVALDVQKHCARAAHPAPHNRTATAPSREHVTCPDQKSSSAMRAQIAEDQRFSRYRKGRRDETPDRLMARPDAEVVEMAVPPIVAAARVRDRADAAQDALPQQWPPSARSPSASRWTRNKFASWGRKAHCCVRSSPYPAQNRQVLEYPVLYRSVARQFKRVMA